MIVYPAHQPSLITDLYKVTDIFDGQFQSPSIELKSRHCAYLMDTDKSGNEIHHHDLHLEALFRLFQLLQEFLGEIWIKRDVWWFRVLWQQSFVLRLSWRRQASVTLRIVNQVNSGEIEHFYFPLLLVFLPKALKQGTRSIWTQMWQSETWFCRSHSSGTLRTFIAFSSFFLFLVVFLPVENLTFRSRTDGPSAWKKRIIFMKQQNKSKNTFVHL